MANDVKLDWYSSYQDQVSYIVRGGPDNGQKLDLHGNASTLWAHGVADKLCDWTLGALARRLNQEQRWHEAFRAQYDMKPGEHDGMRVAGFTSGQHATMRMMWRKATPCEVLPPDADLHALAGLSRTRMGR